MIIVDDTATTDGTHSRKQDIVELQSVIGKFFGFFFGDEKYFIVSNLTLTESTNG